METTAPPSILQYFPLIAPRDKQAKALEFVESRVQRGFRNIIVEAPTGIGKSAIGVATGLWACGTQLQGETGAYYLVTQKLLQDQLEQDFPDFVPEYQRMGASLKSSAEYPCDKYRDCQTGGRQRKDRKCPRRVLGTCPYSAAYRNFVRSPVSVTNYPYFFTERTHVGRLNLRQVLVLDECHSIERQVLNFIEVVVDKKSLEEWAPSLRPVPSMPDIAVFAKWLRIKYLPLVSDRYKFKLEQSQDTDDRAVHQEVQSLEAHLTRVRLSVDAIDREPDNWVYWQERGEDGLVSVAKPIDASPYTGNILFDNADLKLFMSAYVGPKDIFCRSLGIDPAATASISLNSTFPISNRPIHLLFAGSMGRKSIDTTTPALLNKIDKIMRVHAEERGIIHVHSYKLGQAVYNYLKRSEHAGRVLYAAKASERATILAEHTRGNRPTVIISPSMTEGFSFDDDLARWQIIAKMPYASLGDKQVAAKKDRDQEWYVLQTVSTFLQTAGRIVRSDTDHGVTYVLDSDFQGLYDRYQRFFPAWLTSAFQWH